MTAPGAANVVWSRGILPFRVSWRPRPRTSRANNRKNWEPGLNWIWRARLSSTDRCLRQRCEQDSMGDIRGFHLDVDSNECSFPDSHSQAVAGGRGNHFKYIYNDVEMSQIVHSTWVLVLQGQRWFETLGGVMSHVQPINVDRVFLYTFCNKCDIKTSFN